MLMIGSGGGLDDCPCCPAVGPFAELYLVTVSKVDLIASIFAAYHCLFLTDKFADVDGISRVHTATLPLSSSRPGLSSDS